MVGVNKLLLLALAVVQAKSRNTDHCYAHNDHPYLHFGTRTSYQIYHGGNTSYQTIPNCKPIQIWMLTRHGTRYPSKSEARGFKSLQRTRNRIIGNHENHGRLCDADLENLKNWRLDPEFTRETQGELSIQGIVDMKELGQRIKSNFPELFPPIIENVSSANYKFRAPTMARTNSSMSALMSGIFDTLPFPDEDIPEEDLFKTNAHCPRWTAEVDKNPEITEMIENFKNGPEVQGLISNVSSRLGYRHHITFDQIQHMWDMCRYDKAWKVNDLSPWCAVFSDEELRVLEYKEDLYDYYHRGSGHQLNTHLGCPLLRDMLQHFERLENTNDYSEEPKGIFNAARSASVHFFMAAMGLAKDAPSLTENFDDTTERRWRWRTSEIGTFSTNIFAVFYKCNDTTNSPNKVMFYLAEKPLHFKGCDAAGVCDWEYVKNKYKEAVLNCGPDICQLTRFSTLTNSDVFILIWFIALLTVGLSFRRFLRSFYSSSIPLYQRFRLRFNYKIPLVHLFDKVWRGRYTKLRHLQVV